MALRSGVGESRLPCLGLTKDGAGLGLGLGIGLGLVFALEEIILETADGDPAFDKRASKTYRT